MRILRARLLAAAQEEADAGGVATRGAARCARSTARERIRTYNFPENRIADHRVGYKAYNLDQVLDGDLDAVVAGAASTPTPTRRARRPRRDRPSAARPLLADGRTPGSPAAGRRRRRGYDAEELAGARRSGVAAGADLLAARRAGDAERFDGAASTGGPPGSRCSTSPGVAASATSSSRSGRGSSCPRPETEVRRRVGASTRLARRRTRPPVVVDLCTGSGAIALAVAHEVPGARSTPSSCDPARTPGPRATCAGLGGRPAARATWPTRLPRARRHASTSWSATRRTSRTARDPRPGGGRPRPGRSRCGPAPDGLDVVRVVEQVAARLLRPGRPGRRRARRRAGRAGARGLRARPAAGGDVADHPDLAGRDRYVTAPPAPMTAVATGCAA